MVHKKSLYMDHKFVWYILHPSRQSNRQIPPYSRCEYIGWVYFIVKFGIDNFETIDSIYSFGLVLSHQPYLNFKFEHFHAIVWDFCIDLENSGVVFLQPHLGIELSSLPLVPSFDIHYYIVPD